MKWFLSWFDLNFIRTNTNFSRSQVAPLRKEPKKWGKKNLVSSKSSRKNKHQDDIIEQPPTTKKNPVSFVDSIELVSRDATTLWGRSFFFWVQTRLLFIYRCCCCWCWCWCCCCWNLTCKTRNERGASERAGATCRGHQSSTLISIRN